MKTKHFFLIPIITFTIMYMFVAFIQADFNPYKWDKTVRAMYILISTVFSLGMIGIYMNEENLKQ